MAIDNYPIIIWNSDLSVHKFLFSSSMLEKAVSHSTMKSSQWSFPRWSYTGCSKYYKFCSTNFELAANPLKHNFNFKVFDERHFALLQGFAYIVIRCIVSHPFGHRLCFAKHPLSLKNSRLDKLVFRHSGCWKYMKLLASVRPALLFLQ